MILDSLKQAIKEIGPVAVQLAQYDFGVSGPGAHVTGSNADNHLAPAIFTQSPAPADAKAPFISLAISGTDDFQTKGSRGGIFTVSATVWGDLLQTDYPLRNIAFNLWNGLNRKELAITHYKRVCIHANPPVRMNDSQGFPGYVVTLEIPLLEE